MTVAVEVEPLRRVGVLLGAGEYAAAEGEILRALAARPDDLRALRLLALVRFKLGRLPEAREAYQALARAVPGDAAVRLSLGLIALKLDWIDEATAELEIAVRLRPDDRRAWAYLGYAHVRGGRRVEAAAAFRRAGQDLLARQAEAGQAPTGAFADPDGAGGAQEEAEASVDATQVEGFAPAAADPEGHADDAPSSAELSLTNLVLARAFPEPEATLGSESITAHGDDLLHFGVRGEAHVCAAALLVASAGLSLTPARARAQGRVTEDDLVGSRGRFWHCAGEGELWLSAAGGCRVAVRLHEDILYCRLERVQAFADALAWEVGRLPGAAEVVLLQLRGSGRVVLDVAVDGLRAFRLVHGARCQVPRERLLGWVGRVVARAEADLCVCEGEGMLLIAARDGQG